MSEDVAFWGLMTVAAVLLWLSTADARRARREAKRARKQAEWDAHIASILTDADRVVERMVRPLSDAPGFDRITNLIAANEVARADWDEPRRWSDSA